MHDLTTSPRILGISASPRNPWPGPGASRLDSELARLPDKAALWEYIRCQGELCLENYLEAGRSQGLGFQEIYANLRKSVRTAGLSNSELALSASLWGAADRGAEIRHLPLSAHFTPKGLVAAEVMREMLLWADGYVISGPVYFGDRSSLVKSLQDFIMADSQLYQSLRGKVYGGVAVGAKRNGGQETTLIYQLVDMLEMGMLGVGNDSDTTAQYGGTCHAGDVGSVVRDELGLATALGVGRRLAGVLSLLGSPRRLRGKPKALVLLLQDADDAGRRLIDFFSETLSERLDLSVVDFTSLHLRRCMACDICPARLDTDESYRCLIQSDPMAAVHASLLDCDMLVPVVASARDPRRVRGDYQTFMERTRYLRRGDYIWSDMLVAPVVLQEAGGVSTYPIRMLTSLIRHHTVMSRPLVGRLRDGVMPDAAELADGLAQAAEQAGRLAAGRLARSGKDGSVGYNPIGYVLSADKTREDSQLEKRREIVASRGRRLQRLARERLLPGD